MSFDAGDVAKAFKRADDVVKVKLYNQRLSPTPMEPRGVVAQFDEGTGSLTVLPLHAGPARREGRARRPPLDEAGEA